MSIARASSAHCGTFKVIFCTTAGEAANGFDHGRDSA
jgi:hypothetical protein